MHGMAFERTVSAVELSAIVRKMKSGCSFLASGSITGWSCFPSSKAEASMTYPNPGKNLLQFACHLVYQSPQLFDVNLLETGFVS